MNRRVAGASVADEIVASVAADQRDGGGGGEGAALGAAGDVQARCGVAERGGQIDGDVGKGVGIGARRSGRAGTVRRTDTGGDGEARVVGFDDEAGAASASALSRAGAGHEQAAPWREPELAACGEVWREVCGEAQHAGVEPPVGRSEGEDV